MKLATKFTLALVLVTTVVLATNAGVLISRQTRQYERDMAHDDQLLGRTIEAALIRNFQVGGGDPGARSLVRAVAAKETTVAVTWTTEPESSRLGLTEAERAAIDAHGSVIQRRTAKTFDTYTGITVGGVRHGVLVLSEPLSGEEDFAHEALGQAVVGFVATAVACGALALLLGVYFVGRPMRELVQFARRIGAGDFTPRLHVTQRDEIGALSRELNAMAEHLAQLSCHAEREHEARLAALEQLRHAERLATVGKLAAGIAHELGTPLAVVSGRARLILEQASGIAKIIRQLLDFARRRPPRKVREDVQRLAQGTLELLRPMAEKRRVELALEGSAGPVFAEVDGGQIQQALTNLVVNGIQAMADGGRLAVSCEPAPDAVRPSGVGGSGPVVRLRVTDEGSGIPEEIRERIFEPFFTTKGVGEGTGLGLSVTYGIVQEHGGWIAVDSQAGHGSCFAVHLPV